MPTLKDTQVHGQLYSFRDASVSDWARSPQKPEYTAEEVGALPADTPVYSLDILGRYDTLEELTAAHPTGKAGQAFAVGSAESNEVYIWSAEQQQWQSIGSVQGKSGLTPFIGENGNWFIGETDTGVKAAAENGLTPHIGANGNWWIGDQDTGVSAGGSGNGDMLAADYDPDGAVKQAGGIARYVETNAPSNVVRYDEPQELSEEQKAQARENIGAGTSDFSGNYNDLDNIPNSFTPAAHAASHKKGGADALTAEDIDALPNAGGTASGTIEVRTTEAKEIGFKAKNSYRQISLIISGSNNAGIYDHTNGKWLFGHYSSGALFSANHTPPTSNGFRQSKLVSSDTAPTSNGDINWTYG